MPEKNDFIDKFSNLIYKLEISLWFKIHKFSLLVFLHHSKSLEQKSKIMFKFIKRKVFMYVFISVV